jgi:hypothetical protein
MPHGKLLTGFTGCYRICPDLILLNLVNPVKETAFPSRVQVVRGKTPQTCNALAARHRQVTFSLLPGAAFAIV